MMKIQEWINFQSKRVFSNGPKASSNNIKFSCKNLSFWDSSPHHVSLNKICEFLLNKVKSD
jgi:hypothetical protein